MSALGGALRVVRAEGFRGAGDRALDRLAEMRRRRSFRAAESFPAGFRTSVLDLIATPPAPRLGGVQIQLLRRLEVEGRQRPTALLYPEPGGYRLELAAGSDRRALAFPAPPLPQPPALEDAAFEQAVLRAGRATGAELLNVEGLAGFPPASLLALHRQGLRLAVWPHDFAAFCPRPHLLEHPFLAFCHYSRDPQRCARCLAQDWPVAVGWQEARRALAEQVLAAADTVFYPSEFLRRAHLELFPTLDPSRQRVVSPEPVATPPARRHAVRNPPRHVAYVGSVMPHKGALVFEEVVRRLAGAGSAGVRWSVYGGGDEELLVRLRRLPGVRVRGYYRSGTLPELLAADEVDLALLLSVVPESYGFTLSECQAAGVPAVAFDLGALGERLRGEAGGHLVPLAAGADGVVSLLSELLARR